MKLGLPKSFELPVSKEELMKEPKITTKYIDKMDLGIDSEKVLVFIEKAVLDEKSLWDKNTYLNG